MDWLSEQWLAIREQEEWFAWIGIVSVATVIASALLVPLLVRRIPHDYFLEHSRGADWMRDRHPVTRVMLLVLKNVLGAVLVIGGLIMLVTPGQGILTLVVGILLLNFPGKRRFEVWLVKRKPVHRAIDWMRRRAGRRPLELPES